MISSLIQCKFHVSDASNYLLVTSFFLLAKGFIKITIFESSTCPQDSYILGVGMDWIFNDPIHIYFRSK